MKLTFSTLICPGYTEEELSALCAEFGMDAVEFRTDADAEFKVTTQLKIIDIASSFCLFDYDKDKLNSIKSVLGRMHEARIGAIRIFLGNFQRRYDDPARDIDYDGIVKMLRRMCDMSPCGIWVETHNEFATGKTLQKLMKDVDRDNIKIIWDVMHPFEDGELPEETFSYIKDYIAHVHIKDGRKKSDPAWHDFEYTPLGEGEVPVKEIIGLLEGAGYDGYYSLEWESMWRAELKELNWSAKEILTRFKEYMARIEKEI